MLFIDSSRVYQKETFLQIVIKIVVELFDLAHTTWLKNNYLKINFCAPQKIETEYYFQT